MRDNFGDRMKLYESAESNRRFMPLLPVCARIDGKNFSKFTKNFKKPFDYDFIYMMQETTKFLVDTTHAKIGFTQSDEISLIWQQDSYDSQIWFDGRIQKMCSVLAAMATAKFNSELQFIYPDSVKKFPVFDCRVWQVPSEIEASNVILWRAQDAKKNAVSMVCRHYFSAKFMHEKNQEEMKNMLLEKGIDFDKCYNNTSRFGSYFQRHNYIDNLDDDTWNKIPSDKKPDSREVVRSKVFRLNIGYFGEVANRVDVIFNKEHPQ